MNITNNIKQFFYHIGGINKGDSILYIASGEQALDIAVSPLISHFINNNYKILFLTHRKNYWISKYLYKNIKIIGYEELNLKLLPNKIKKFFPSTKNLIIFLDDISVLRNFGLNWKKIHRIYTDLNSFVKRKNANFITTINQTKCDTDQIVFFKDTTSISLGVFKIADNYLLNVLNLKNRYIPDAFIPLKIKTISTENRQVKTTFSKLNLDTLEDKLSLNIIKDDLFKRSFFNSTVPMFLFEWQGDFREPNKKLLSLLGCSIEDFKKSNPIDFVNSADRFRTLKNLVQLKSKKSVSLKIKIQNKSKKYIPVEVTISHLGQDFYLSIIHDISEQIRLENQFILEKEFYLSRLDALNTAVAVFENDLCVYVNKSFSNLTNYFSDSDIPKLKLKQLFSQKDWIKVRNIIRDLQLDSTNIYSECEIQTNSGNTIIYDVAFVKINIGHKKFLQININDISSKVKLIEELKSTTEKYKLLFENLHYPVAIQQNGIYKLCNKAFLSFFNINYFDNIIGKDKSSIGLNEDEKNIKNKTKSTVKTNRYKILTKEGLEKNIEISSISIAFEGSTAELEFYRDITDELKLEDNIKRKVQDFELLNDIIKISNKEQDIEKLSTNSLKYIISKLGWHCGAFYVKKGNDFELVFQNGLQPEILQKISQMDVSKGIGGLVTKTQLPYIFSIDSYPSYLPHKKTFEKEEYSIVAVIPTIYNESVNGLIFLASYNKILNQNNSEKLLSAIGAHIGNAINNASVIFELIKLQQKYEKLISSISDVIYFGDPSNMFSFISPNVETLTGYSQKEFQKNKSIILSIVHPDDRKIILSRNAKINEIEGKNIIEYRILPRAKAEYIWIRDSINLIKNENGDVELIYGVLSDINEQKNLEVTLKNTEQFKSGILAGIREGVIVLDRDFNFLDWNDAMERITGLPRYEVLGKNISEIPELLGKNVNMYLEQALNGEVVSTEDIAFKINETNKEGYLWGKFAPLKDNLGNIIGIVAIISDITKRKKLEEEIKYAEQLQRNVIDTIGDFFVLTDLKGTVLQVNKEFINTMGYSRSEALGQEFPYPWLVEEEMSRFVIWVSNLRTKNYLHDFDMTWQTKDGRRIAISLNTTLLRNSYGEPIAMLNLARNISERKKLAKDLEHRNKLIESINNIIQTANQTTDFEKIFRTFADNIYGIVPFSKIEICLLKGENIEILGSYLKPDDKFELGIVQELNSNISKIAQIMKIPILVNDANEDERLIIHNIIEDQYLSILSFPVFSEGKIFATINLYAEEANSFEEELLDSLKPFVEQMGAITDRILLFNQVSNDATYIHNLLDSIDKIIFTVDEKFIIREVNKAWFNFIKKINPKVKKSYSDRYLFDEIPKDIFGIDLLELSRDIIESKTNFVSKEVELELSDTEKYIYLLTINPMIISDKITGQVFTLTDITELKRTELALKVLNKKLIELNKISSHIASSFDINDIFHTALPAISNLLDADYISIWFTDQIDINKLVLKKLFISELNNLIDYQHNVWITENNYASSIYASSWNEIPDWFKENLIQNLKLEVNAFVSVPIKSHDKILGILQIMYRNQHAFSNQEEQLISMIGNQFGTAIDNAQLYSTLQAQLLRLNILYELSQQLTATLDVNQILEVINTHLLKIVDFDELIIKFIDEGKLLETTILHIKSVEQEKLFIPRNMQSENVPFDSPLWEVISSKKTVVNQNSNGSFQYFIPMASKNNIIGAIILTPKNYLSYDETEISMLENVCSLVAIAIEKTKLYEETVQKSKEIQKRNKELDDFTYVVSHDLKEPLISIEGYSQILKEEYKDIFNREPAEYIDSIVKATGRMKNLIDDLLTLSRISRISESFRPVQLNSVIKEVETDLSYALSLKRIKFIKPEITYEFFGNETQIKMVFRNLISNAIKFSDKPDPFIEIGCQDYDSDYYLCFVKDNGIGIDERYFEKIFVIFQRLHTREEYEGTGAGLAIVKKIIEIHKGKIWVESKPGEGSIFYFTLPKHKK